MGKIYRTYVPHGITFEKSLHVSKHTWRDWKIVPTSRPVFNPPKTKILKIDIPGSDGIIDMTESLTGEVHYNNREGTLEFQVENKQSWYEVYSDILDYLHGQYIKAILDDDLGYYYVGRFYVNEWKSEKNHSSIVFDYDLNPYKYQIISSLDDWIWDTFNFETGDILPNMNNMIIDGFRNITFRNTKKSIIPTFTVISTNGEGMTASVSNNKGIVNLTLPDGVTKNPTFILCEGSNTISIRGNGTVTVDFRRARL